MAEDTNAKSRESNGPMLPPVELGDMSMGDSIGNTKANSNVHGDASEATHTTSTIPEETTVGTSETPAQAMEPSIPVSEAATRPTQSTESSRAQPPPPIDIPLTRKQSEAIGPSTDLPTPMLTLTPSALGSGPVVQFTLLLASTGTRHPFQLNERYLTKRNVVAKNSEGDFDPAAISVYNLKELILKDWREDWDAKPSSPSAIRLIFFGQLLADNVSLRDCKLQTDGSANVLHITVKPQDVMDDEEAAGKGGKTGSTRGGRGDGSSSGCRCIIM